MYNFIVQAYSTYRGLFQWLNWAGYLSNVVFRPIAIMMMYSILGRFAGNPAEVQSYVLGVAAYSMVLIIVPSITQSYTNDRGYGTLAFLYASPASRFVNFCSRITLHYPNALISFAASLITASLLVHMDFSLVNWGAFILAIALTGVSIAAFGQFLGIFAIILRDWGNVQTISTGLLLILTGVIIPVTVFPAAMQELVKLLPMANGLIAIREVFIGASLSEVAGSVAREIITGLVYFGTAYFGFVTFERVAKKRGTLEIEAF
jgi:ABC-type polysaccharide/polyol phosphate export permease